MPMLTIKTVQGVRDTFLQVTVEHHKQEVWTDQYMSRYCRSLSSLEMVISSVPIISVIFSVTMASDAPFNVIVTLSVCQCQVVGYTSTIKILK